MTDTAFGSLGAGLAVIDDAITDKVLDGSITPEIHGGILRRLLHTVYEVSAVGTSGSGWLGGTGTPAAELGSVGDHYVQYEDGSVYQKVGEVTWSDTGFSIRGEQGIQGDAGDPGAPGADGASRDLRIQGTELQTKLSTEPLESYVAIFDTADIRPVIAVDSNSVLTYRLSQTAAEDAEVLYDLTGIHPTLRVEDGIVQWKLAVQAVGSYQDLFDLDSITPVFRLNAGNLEYKYADQDDTEYVILGPMPPA